MKLKDNQYTNYKHATHNYYFYISGKIFLVHVKYQINENNLTKLTCSNELGYIV